MCLPLLAGCLWEEDSCINIAMLCWDAAVASFPVLGHGDRLPFVALSAPIRLIDAESAGRSQLQSLQLLGQGRLAHSFFAKAKPYQLSRAVVLEQIQAAIYLCSMLVHCKFHSLCIHWSGVRVAQPAVSATLPVEARASFSIFSSRACHSIKMTPHSVARS